MRTSEICKNSIELLLRNDNHDFLFHRIGAYYMEIHVHKQRLGVVVSTGLLKFWTTTQWRSQRPCQQSKPRVITKRENNSASVSARVRVNRERPS